MFRNGTIEFKNGTFSGAIIERFEFESALSELWELTVEVHVADSAADPFDVVGHAASLRLPSEPFVKRIDGIVRRMRQLSSEPTGVSAYELSIVPPLWLLTRSRNNRIFQHATAVDIVRKIVVEEHNLEEPLLRLDPSYERRKREYCVQYDETDYDFVMRVLSEDGITSLFEHDGLARWSLLDDTTAGTNQLTVEADDSGELASGAHPGAVIPFRARAEHLFDPHLSAVVIGAGIETSQVTLRDWDHRHVGVMLQGQATEASERLFVHEAGLRDYRYEVGPFRRENVGKELEGGKQLARRTLEAERSARRRLGCTPSFLVPAGTTFTITDHPREDVNVPVLVVRSTMVGSDDSEGHYGAECMDLGVPFRPDRRPKKRIYGTQTALVATDDEATEIDVDPLGRVLVLFRWDERDDLNRGASRRVRVSQGWASAGFGFTMHPRRGDEVIIAFLDGDPDEPIIVGRVHNSMYRPPARLPDHKTQSIWLSRSSPAPKDGEAGFNKIMMEDLSGHELLEMHAQRDYKRHTNRNETISVGGSQSTSVGGSESHSAGADISITAGTSISENAGTTMDLHALGGDLTATASANVTIGALGGDLTATASQAAMIEAQGGDLVEKASAGVFIQARGGDLIEKASGGVGIAAEGGDITASASAGVTVHARGGNLSEKASASVSIAAEGGNLSATAAANLWAHADAIATLDGGAITHVSAPAVFIVGGSSADVSAPKVLVEGSTITISGAGVVNVKGGTVNVTGGGAVNVNGGTVNLNC